MQAELETELKQIDTLHSLLDDLQKQLTRATFAAAALLLLGIGWFASEDVAAFLKDHPHFAWIAVLAPVFATALYCYGASLIYKRSQQIAGTLRHFDDPLVEIYQSSAVSRTQFLVFSGGIVLLAMGLAACIYVAVHSPVQEPNEQEILMQAALPRHAHLRLQAQNW
jgi:hypothetical protein